MNPVRAEIRRLAALALPVAATQVGTMLLGFVDTLMLGRVSTDALAASAIANVWIFGTSQFAVGILFGLDPIVAQAHGAGQGAVAGRALQRGIVLALLLSDSAGAALARLRALPGRDGSGTRAWRRSRSTTPGCRSRACRSSSVYNALRQYLQGREIVRPAFFVMVIANLRARRGKLRADLRPLGMRRRSASSARASPLR